MKIVMKVKNNSKSNKRFTVNYFNKDFNHISNIAIKENSKYLIIRQIIFLLILIEFQNEL